ncbi:Cap15 family cyclic dinucleotide receptor domain-containing protein [Lelliottia jeotgali]
MRSHEYALIDGINRASIGRYVGAVSAAVSALLVLTLFWAVDLVERYGLPVNITPSFIALISAGTVYLALYWIFNCFVWRWGWVQKLLKVPDLKGTWTCKGVSRKGKREFVWEGTIDIYQCWDRLRIKLKTESSGSNSVVAAVSHDDTGGFRLIYSYANDPKADGGELRSHVGFCNMEISHDQQSAEGNYFTGRGRSTSGQMTWTRKR